MLAITKKLATRVCPEYISSIMGYAHMHVEPSYKTMIFLHVRRRILDSPYSMHEHNNQSWRYRVVDVYCSVHGAWSQLQWLQEVLKGETLLDVQFGTFDEHLGLPLQTEAKAICRVTETADILDELFPDTATYDPPKLQSTGTLFDWINDP